AAYVGSKHAVLGIVRSVALDLGRRGIRVNALAPGPIATDALLGRMRRRERELGIPVEDALAAAARQAALRRIATVADVADAAPGAARLLWRDAVALRPRIDVVVVNAGVAPETPFDGTDEAWDAGWEQTMRVNVLEAANLIREAVGHFRANGGGIVISLSSWA